MTISTRVKRLLLYVYWRSKPRRSWRLKGYPPPAPQRVKRAVLLRHSPDLAAWVETGTHVGRMAEFLASRAEFVWTIEPDPSLFATARRRLAAKGNVKQICGTSEDEFERVLVEAIALNKSICVWLDGHYSGGPTFLGNRETPIRDELCVLERNMGSFNSLTVFVDDFRSFGAATPVEGSYPTKTFLVDWADSNALEWTVEHDIFIARSP